MTAPQRIVRNYHIEAMSNGYSLKILGEPPSQTAEPAEIEHYVAGGMRGDTKPATLRRRIIGYAVGELKEQLERALDAADESRPELELPAAPAPPPAEANA